MKKSDVKIGMKVVPIRKSAVFFSSKLSNSAQWKLAKERGQKFLYVIGWREFAKSWSLAASKDSASGDWFKSHDFHPYTGK